MQFPLSDPTKLRPMQGLEIDMVKFRQLLHLNGWRLTWEQAAKCPCRESPESDHPRPDCTVCGGFGWDYHDAQEVKAIVTSAIQVAQPLQRHSTWGRGHFFVSTMPEQLPGYGDRFTAKQSIFLMKDFATRTANASDRLRYKVAPRTMILSTGTVTVGVTYCRPATADGIAANTVLVEGTDFAVTAGGEIDWTLGDNLGTAPAAGIRYSMTYYAHPRLVVIEDMYSARDSLNWKKNPNPPTHKPMPTRVMCRLEYEGDEDLG